MTDIVGKYWLEVIIAGLMDVPFLGEIQILTRSVLQVELVEEDNELWHSQTLCWVESYDSTRVSETHIPPEFVSAIPSQRVASQYIDGELSWDPQPVLLGVSEAGELPKNIDSPRVLDADNDGMPGVTVLLEIPLIGMVELYLIQYNDIQLSGRWAGDALEGKINIQTLEQETLGSSHSVFTRSNKLQPNASESYFRMQRIEENDCSILQEIVKPLNPKWRR